MPETATRPRRTQRLPVRGLRIRVPDHGDEVATDDERIRVGSTQGNDLVLQDEMVSRYHLSFIRRGAHIAVVDHDSTNGTQIGPVLLRGGEVLVRPGTKLSVGRTELVIDDGRATAIDAPDRFGGLIGEDLVIRQLMANATRVAAGDASVLLVGESGTGKELMARGIHDHSARSAGPFVVVDCGALPPSVFTAELFGHEPGAFTGASTSRPGALERANGGTLMLDEIGELPPSAQAALLGCLERRRIVRLGGRKEIPLDFRLVSATNRDLRADVNRGAFRLDLFYRIAIVELALPPLRDHVDDIEALIVHFMAELGAGDDVESVFSQEALREMRAYAWPGNVRELRNAVAATLATGSEPSFRASPSQDHDQLACDLEQPYKDARNQLLRAFEAQYLARLLQRAEGSVRRAAREAKMDRSYLTDLLRRHGLR